MNLEDLQKTKSVFENGAFVQKADGTHIGIYDAYTRNTTLYLQDYRMPLEANRIFKTKAHMLAYIEDRINVDGTISAKVTEDTIKSALPGIILTVINDEDPKNNGMYYIENADPETTPGLSAAKINITGPIPNEKIDLLFPEEPEVPEEQE